jgi:hypothetical protein
MQVSVGIVKLDISVPFMLFLSGYQYFTTFGTAEW